MRKARQHTLRAAKVPQAGRNDLHLVRVIGRDSALLFCAGCNRLRRTCRQEKSATRDRMYCTSTTLFIRARSNLLRRLRVLLIIPFLQQIRALRRDAPQSFRTICTVQTIMSSSASVADRCLPFIVSSHSATSSGCVTDIRRCL